MTTHSPARILSEQLIAKGIFGDPDSSSLVWPLYVAHEPEDPDDIGTIYDTLGIKDGRIMLGGQNIFHPGILIRVRAADYDEGWEKCEEVVAELQALTSDDQVEVEGIIYTLSNTSQTGPTLFLGVEEGIRRRSLFTINFIATLKEE